MSRAGVRKARPAIAPGTASVPRHPAAETGGAIGVHRIGPTVGAAPIARVRLPLAALSALLAALSPLATAAPSSSPQRSHQRLEGGLNPIAAGWHLRKTRRGCRSCRRSSRGPPPQAGPAMAGDRRRGRLWKPARAGNARVASLPRGLEPRRLGPSTRSPADTLRPAGVAST